MFIGVISQRSVKLSWTSTVESPSSGSANLTQYRQDVGGYVADSSFEWYTLNVQSYDGGTMSVPNPSGYTFDGWYTFPANKGTADSINIGQATVGISTSRTIGYQAVASSAKTYTDRLGNVYYMVYPKWKRTFRVTFNGNGGTPAEQYEDCEQGGSVTCPSAPTRTGYSFLGWYTAASGGTKVGDAGDIYTPTASVPLYAQWDANTYTVTLDMQGGSGGTSSVTATYGSAMPSATMPTRAGYTFNGYFTGTDGSGTKYYNADGTSAQSWDITDDTTLYAYWQAETYAVTLDMQDGSGGTSSVTATYGSAMPSATMPTRAGYAFNGYFTGTDGSGTKYYNADGTSARNWDVAGNTTLYAYWIQQYALTLTKNEHILGLSYRIGSSGSYTSVMYSTTVMVDEGAEVYLYANPDTGYSTEYTSNNPYVTTMGPGGVEFAPTATAKSYSIPFNPNGGMYNGTTSRSYKTMTYDSTNNSDIGVATRTGYRFAGWNTNRDGSGEMSFDAAGHAKAGSYWSADYSAVDNQAKWKSISFVEFFAQWAAATVVFALLDAAGGISSPAILELTTGGTYAGLPTPIRANYSFDGWFTAETGGTQVTDATPVTSAVNHILYAHWTAQSTPAQDGDLIYDDATGRLIYDDRPVEEY